MQVISTDKAPQALGPYSQAIVAGNTVYCSGQIAINPATGELVLENIEAEAEQVMKNIGAVLEAAGCTYANIKKPLSSQAILMTLLQSTAYMANIFK